MGFSTDDDQAYIRSIAGHDEELLKGLQTYTSCYPHIESMMYNPLSAAIVVKVYKNSWKEKNNHSQDNDSALLLPHPHSAATLSKGTSIPQRKEMEEETV